jgi:hypothetical protein
MSLIKLPLPILDPAACAVPRQNSGRPQNQQLATVSRKLICYTPGAEVQVKS